MFVNVWQPKVIVCRECGYEIYIDSNCENCATKESN